MQADTTTDVFHNLMAAYKASPVETSAAMWLAAKMIEQQGDIPSVTARALQLTDKSEQSKAAAEAQNLVASGSKKGFILSPVGEELLQHPALLKQLKLSAWDKCKGNAAEDKTDLKDKKKAVNEELSAQFGLEKLAKGRGITCQHGCKRNNPALYFGPDKTGDEDENAWFCLRNDECRERVAKYYGGRTMIAAAPAVKPKAKAPVKKVAKKSTVVTDQDEVEEVSAAETKRIEAKRLADLVAENERLRADNASLSAMDDDDNDEDDEVEETRKKRTNPSRKVKRT